MNKYEEVFLISQLISKAGKDNSVELNSAEDWKDLFLKVETRLNEDYLYELDEKGILYFEEVGEDGFKPIIMCSVQPETLDYLRKLLHEMEENNNNKKRQIEELNKRITEILTFNPKKLSEEINSTGIVITKTRDQLKSNPILQPLNTQLDQIETHFKSLSSVAQNYEEVYKNIILPVKEEGKNGVRQTVKWAVISILLSTILSVIISLVMREYFA